MPKYNMGDLFYLFTFYDQLAGPPWKEYGQAATPIETGQCFEVEQSVSISKVFSANGRKIEGNWKLCLNMFKFKCLFPLHFPSPVVFWRSLPHGPWSMSWHPPAEFIFCHTVFSKCNGEGSPTHLQKYLWNIHHKFANICKHDILLVAFLFLFLSLSICICSFLCCRSE